MQETVVPEGPSPPDLSDSVLSLLPGVLFDGTPIGSHFGDVVAQPYPMAYTGETVTAKFVSVQCIHLSHFIDFLHKLLTYLKLSHSIQGVWIALWLW